MPLVHMPLSQHVGPSATAVVSPDEKVKRGQLLAKPEGLGAKIHAGVSGRVREVTETEIVLDAHAEQTGAYEPIPETHDPWEAIEEAGIVGAGGAGFPSHVKLKADMSDGLVIANGSECEPLLQHNTNFMEENPEVVVRGLKYLQEITGAPRACIAIKEKNRKAVHLLRRVCEAEKDISLHLLPDMYPAGDERVVVREVIGEELAPGQLPQEQGALVHNVETIKRMVEAVEERKPFIDKDLTVAGRVNDAPRGRVFMDVPVGTPVGELIEACGDYRRPYGEIVLGGPYTGVRGSHFSPVTKFSGGVLVSMPFPRDNRNMGIVSCECGAQEERLKEIAQDMGATVMAESRCKRMVEVNGRYRCDKPGVCPGQAETVMQLKKKNVQVLLTGSCGE